MEQDFRAQVDKILRDAIHDAEKRLEYAQSKNYSDMVEQAQRLLEELRTRAVKIQLERSLSVNTGS
jgi:hypothetical protein